MKPIHPSVILKKEFNISKVNSANSKMRRFLSGKESIDQDLANVLSVIYQNTPEFWLNLQARYDREIDHKRKG